MRQKYYSMAQMVALLQHKYNTVRAAVLRGVVKPQKIGCHWLFTQRDIDALRVYLDRKDDHRARPN
jgi:hypothetical protein